MRNEGPPRRRPFRFWDAFSDRITVRQIGASLADDRPIQRDAVDALKLSSIGRCTAARCLPFLGKAPRKLLLSLIFFSSKPFLSDCGARDALLRASGCANIFGSSPTSATSQQSKIRLSQGQINNKRSRMAAKRGVSR